MSNGAVGSLRQLIACIETAEGTIPAAPAWKEIPTTGGSGITIGFGTVESAVIRSDQQTPLPGQGNKAIGLNIPVEFAYGWMDDLLESLFRAAFNTNVLLNGTTRKAFTFEEGFTDIDQYRVGHGFIAHRGKLSLRQGAKVSGSFDLLGLVSDAWAQASIATSFTAAAEKETFGTYLGSILEGGSAFSGIQSLDVDIDGKGSHKYELFMQEPSFNSLGRIKITGSMTTYFKDVVVANKFLAGTPTSISFTLTDPAGNDLLFELLHIRYTGESKTISEDDVPVTFPFAAGVDPVSGKMIRITRTAA